MDELEFTKDLAENGLRFDLNPTMMWNDESTLSAAYVSYIKRMDASIRERANAVLTREQ